MKGKVELLAPAGDWDAFLAAIENGADAVYLGGKLFNARQYAGNFDAEQLNRALEYAHVRDARVYLTMNTLVADEEMEQAMKLASEAYSMGIDGIIVQDLGLAALLKDAFPDLNLHASTQMTIYNLEGVKMLEQLGFKRVVLARELSLEEIRHIAGNTQLELEVFIHGALCICYSGQCLMSSIIGGRSGNRGKCAQPCRLPYKLEYRGGNVWTEKGGSIWTAEGNSIWTAEGISAGTAEGWHGNDGGGQPGRKGSWPGRHHGDRNGKYEDRTGKYLLSPKDLCTVDMLPEILASGVKSLKIEGRMKTPEYVATVVRIYRKYLDMAAGVQLAKAGPAGKDLVNVDPVSMDLEKDAARVKVDERDVTDLAQVFNRGGFTSGYLRGKSGADMMSWEKPKNWGIYLGDVISYDARRKTVKIRLEEDLAIGDGVEVWNGEDESPGTLVTEITARGKKLNAALRGETVEIGSISGRISKGDRVYKTSDKSLNTVARESFTGGFHRKVPLKGVFTVHSDVPAVFELEDDRENKVRVEGSLVPEAAVNRPLTEERAAAQLNKTGNTPFIFEKLELRLEGNLSLPVSEINDIRRRALEEMERLRLKVRPLIFAEGAGQRAKETLESHRLRIFTGLPGKNLDGAKEQDQDTKEQGSKDKGTQDAGDTADTIMDRKLGISVFLYRQDRLGILRDITVDRLYLPFAAFLRDENRRIIDEFRGRGIKVFAWLPNITRGNYDRLIKKELPGIMAGGLDGLLIGNPGHVELVKGLAGAGSQANGGDVKIIGDYSLNIYNSISMEEASRLGLEGVTLSPELTLAQAGRLGSIPGLEKEAVVYGRLPLMTSEYCPVGSVAGGMKGGVDCSGACMKGDYVLKDRKGMEFPVLCDRIDCRSVILNANVLHMAGNLGRIRDAGVDTARLYIYDEAPDEAGEIIRMYLEEARSGTGIPEKYEALNKKLEARGFTRGHYFRGV